ncbi:radical SAM protein [bacterium]|nr:radical SAM protein [bacterium]
MRTNRGGNLYLDLYGRLSHREPVYSDDLPLYHFKPGESWLQVGSRGCTMRCPFCNTWKHSQVAGSLAPPVSPEQIVEQAVAGRLSGISFGVNEPVHLHEFVYDTFVAAKQAGLHTHMATSGLWSEAPIREMAPVLDAVTVGLKGLNESFYQAELGGELPTVLEAITLLHALDVHLELTWLVIPGCTDKQGEAVALMDFLSRLGTAPPIILVPYEPSFTWSNEGNAATLEHLKAFRAHFKDYGNSVYEAHEDSAENNTRCMKCGRTLVRRGMARLVITSVPHTGRPKSECPTCGTPVPYRI